MQCECIYLHILWWTTKCFGRRVCGVGILVSGWFSFFFFTSSGPVIESFCRQFVLYRNSVEQINSTKNGIHTWFISFGVRWTVCISCNLGDLVFCLIFFSDSHSIFLNFSLCHSRIVIYKHSTLGKCN